MRIIIAIDIIDGKCVRLTRGDYNSMKVYNEDPLEAARQIEASGIGHLHLVDLDGAKAKKIVNQKILEKITRNTSLKVDFGGGIRSERDLKIAFDSGATQVTCGSTAIYDPESFLKWLSVYGSEKIILGADSKGRKVSANGWMENSDLDVVKFISGYAAKGVTYTVCTDIEKDGMLQGPSTELYREILSEVKVNLIASGGITTMKDVDELVKIGCEGLIIGKAVYEGKLNLNELGLLC